ncbi:cell division protein FtsL [Metabacillus iocasae]|uniref:Cell division protein FtsL n=1 Tax=Priestia iocasae TaxID=2291674 RepID=A0ABS2QRV0_9BACI|nr:cell division protein FtsL [Metabacillus iocasae]MBM7701767.1 cell division protein FtsL [Metabacillus iocasae]
MENVAYQVKENQHQHQHQEQKQSKRILKKQRRRISIGEKFIYVGFFAMLLFGAVQIVSNQAALYGVNANIQELEGQIDQQERVNNELKLEVVELSTYERIWTEAKKLGLDLNENNVKVVKD